MFRVGMTKLRTALLKRQQALEKKQASGAEIKKYERLYKPEVYKSDPTSGVDHPGLEYAIDPHTMFKLEPMKSFQPRTGTSAYYESDIKSIKDSTRKFHRGFLGSTREILEKITHLITTEDILPKATLGLPLGQDELVEFGGPGRVMDNFLSRGGDDPITLSTLAPHIPAECAIAKGVARMDEELVKRIAKVWKIGSVNSTQGYILSAELGWRWGVEHIGHNKISNHDVLLQMYYVRSEQWEKVDWERVSMFHPSLLDRLPAEKRPLLGESKRLVLDIADCPRERLEALVGKIGETKRPIFYTMEDLIGYAPPERIVDVARLAGQDMYLLQDIFFDKRYMDGLHALGTLSVDELDAYEIVMDPDEHNLEYANDKVDDIRLEIYARQSSDYGSPWFTPGRELLPEYYSEEVLLNKISRWLRVERKTGSIDNTFNYMSGYSLYKEITFPHPRDYIGDQKGTNAILLAWCLCGCPDS
ncbi:hypothetical protein BX666DRAFT_1880641 [Dichotomocladium elegans]|nr:hypothetical protein BX666DRAFT_1880641 [Dichotomocladium elegans]